MTLTVVLAARASSDLQNKGSLQVFCQTSHRPPQCSTGSGHSYSPSQPQLQVWSTEALYRRRVPVRHSTPSPGWHTVLAAPSGGSASTVSSRLTPSGQGAKFGQPSATRHDRLRTQHSPFHLAQALFIICWGSGSGGTSREVRSAHTQATSSSTASSTIPLPRQLWSEGAPHFPHAACSLIGHLSGLSVFLFLKFLRSPRRAGKSEPCQLVDPNFSRTFPAEETGRKPCQLACRRVPRTLPAKETGSRSCHLQEVDEVAPTIPEAGPVSIGGRIGGTGRGRMQRSSSARLLRRSSQPAWTTKTPLATVPRGDGNVGRGCVDAGSSDGLSDPRSGLKVTPFPSLPCFPFCCPFKPVIRRPSTPRCVRERGAEPIPPIVPERGCVELVRKFMQGDYYIGRGSRERNLKASVFGNPFKIAVYGRAGAIRRYEAMLRKDDDLLKRLPQLSGSRLVCHCRADQACHADSIIAVYRETFPLAYDRSNTTAAAAPSAEVLNRLAQQREVPESDDGSTADEGAPGRGSGWVGTCRPMQIGSGYTRRDICDGQSLASPGRWAVEHRTYPDDETWRSVSSLYTDFSRRVGTPALLTSLALGKVSECFCLDSI